VDLQSVIGREIGRSVSGPAVADGSGRAYPEELSMGTQNARDDNRAGWQLNRRELLAGLAGVGAGIACRVRSLKAE
jgi:hypothetical protein